MKKEKVRDLRSEQEKLLRLYSLWQETRRDDIKRRCFWLLGKILVRQPHFSLRRDFQAAF